MLLQQSSPAEKEAGWQNTELPLERELPAPRVERLLFTSSEVMAVFVRGLREMSLASYPRPLSSFPSDYVFRNDERVCFSSLRAAPLKEE